VLFGFLARIFSNTRNIGLPLNRRDETDYLHIIVQHDHNRGIIYRDGKRAGGSQQMDQQDEIQA
jgi:hypothetical protein